MDRTYSFLFIYFILFYFLFFYTPNQFIYTYDNIQFFRIGLYLFIYFRDQTYRMLSLIVKNLTRDEIDTIFLNFYCDFLKNNPINFFQIKIQDLVKSIKT